MQRARFARILADSPRYETFQARHCPFSHFQSVDGILCQVFHVGALRLYVAYSIEPKD